MDISDKELGMMHPQKARAKNLYPDNHCAKISQFSHSFHYNRHKEEL
jgi:hypothetical protein